MSAGLASMRLAIRQEGQMVNAYVATTTDLAKAIHIGSMSTALLNMRPELFEQFKALMTAGMTTLVEVGTGGTVLSYHEQAAPEHEKAGHA